MTDSTDSLFDLLLTHLSQLTVVAVAVLLLNRLVFRRRPHLASLLWLLVILKAWTPPIFASPTSCFRWSESSPIVSSLPRERPASTQPRDPRPFLVPAEETGVRKKPAEETQQGAPVSKGVVTPGSRNPEARPLLPWFALGVWLLGAGTLAALSLWRRRSILLHLTRSAIPVEPVLESRIRDLAVKIGLRKPPRILLHDAPFGPAAAGVFRPTVLLPRFLFDPPRELELRAILTHELIHLRRRDPLIAQLQLLTQIVLWFHPLIWWGGAQASRARELCCDEESVQSLGGRPSDYAQQLLAFLKLRRPVRSVAAFPGVRPVEVTARRLEHIMKSQNRLDARHWGVRLSLVLLGAALVLPARGRVLGESRGDGVDPVGVDPVGVDPVGVDPVGVDPVAVDPMGVDLVGIDPVGVDPVDAQESVRGSLLTIEEGGGLRRVGPVDDWRHTDFAVGVSGQLYSVEGAYLYRTDPEAGTWRRLGDDAFENTRFMLAVGGELYTIESDGSLYGIDKENGSWRSIGNPGDWKATDCAVGSSDRFYSVEGSFLYETDPRTGEWRRVGDAHFANTRFMVWVRGELYTIETGGNLYRIETRDGTWSRVGEAGVFRNADHAVAVGGRLFTIEGDELYRTDPESGARTRIGRGGFEETDFLLGADGKLYSIRAGSDRVADEDTLLEYRRILDGIRSKVRENPGKQEI